MKKTLFFIVSVLMLVGGSVGFGAMVQWEVADGGNGHYYEAIVASPGITWGQAKDYAELAGGYLVTITSQAENDFVFGLVDNDIYWYHGYNLRGPWIGGFQPTGSDEPDGNWQWVTGEDFVFQNWNIGQPNEFNSDNENSMHLGNQSTRTSKWNDAPEDFAEIQSYVIEAIPEPATLFLLTLGGLILRKRR